MRIPVGTIEDQVVIYVPEKQLIFCKNTIIALSVVKDALRSSVDKIEIPEKNLTIYKEGTEVQFGCLHTTLDNCKQISQNIKDFNKNGII